MKPWASHDTRVDSKRPRGHSTSISNALVSLAQLSPWTLAHSKSISNLYIVSLDRGDLAIAEP